MANSAAGKLVARAKAVFTDSGYRNWLFEKLKARLGYSFEFWGRKTCYDSWEALLAEMDINLLDVLEISPGNNSRWKQLGFRSYSGLQYPEFDICKMKTDRCYDIIIADNVFEHLRYPYSAARNVFEMLNEKGIFLISTPFLVKVHNEPGDYTRWTESGLRCFLEDSGFTEKTIRSWSWGNRVCVEANLKRWAYIGWGRSMTNELEYPVTVWASAQK